MSYRRNSLKGCYIGDYIGSMIEIIQGDTRSLDYRSYVNLKLTNKTPGTTTYHNALMM